MIGGQRRLGVPAASAAPAGGGSGPASSFSAMYMSAREIEVYLQRQMEQNGLGNVLKTGIQTLNKMHGCYSDNQLTIVQRSHIAANLVVIPKVCLIETV